MPNFKKLAKAYEGNALDALKALVSKKSVYDATSISENAPYGAGVKSALDYIAKLGKDYGFQVDTCDGHVTELTVGESGPLIGVYAHADVVPATGKWSTKNPFQATLVGEGKDKKMIARGSSDDKGPLIASFFAIKLLKDNGLLHGYRVRLCAGGDEERGSSCMKYYFETLKKEPSVLGFTPDADFPLIYAEKGMLRKGMLQGNVDLSPIIAMDGGVVSNAVCDKLLVTVPADKKLAEAFQQAGVDGEVRNEGQVMILIFRGKTAHGSMPEKGVNAAAKAFEFLGGYYKNAFLANLGKIIADCHGASFGGNHTAPELGESTYNYGVIHYESRKNTLTLSLDYRYGETAKPEEALAALGKGSGLKVGYEALVPYLYFDKKSTLVATLMKSYKRMTLHLFDKPAAIGGGTYAKEVPNCVAYGGVTADHPGDIHSPNEYFYIDDLNASIAIYADAIAALGKAAQ